MPSNQTNINIGIKYNVDQSSVNAVKKSLQDIQNIKPSNFSGTVKELRDIQDTAHLVETALHNAFNVNLNSLNVQAFNQELRTAGLTVDQVYQQFSRVGAQGQVAFSQMATSILTTNLQLKQTKSLMTSMGETMMNTIKWGIASSVMNSFTNSVRQAFQYAQSLDGALTDIRIVTGDSTEQMRQFAKQANNAAQSLGRSTMDYTKAALTFYQQGLSDEEVQTRTQTVLKAQNITGAGQEMADYLTAVWNGYKVANQEAELYVDKLAAVADSSASNMSQLAVAMSKVASSANALGVPVDNLNAQIATIVATTRQAPESVGNALKTIYSRINDITTGADDAQVSLGNYSKQMASIGFSVLDANGNLRDTGDVLDEIGGKWQTLSREQQIYLARTMAGQRQYNNLIALFDNWGKYTDLVNVSMDAQGTTMQKNARYMDSLEAKMEQFGAAGEKVKDALIDEDDLKGLISSVTNIINLFGSFIESIGGGGNALLAFGGIITQLFSNTIAKEINNTIINIQNAKSNLQALNADRQNVETFLQSQGYKDGVIKEVLQAKDAAQQYYKYMSTAQINEHNQLLKNIAAAKQDVLVLNERRDAAQAFAKSFAMSKVSKGTAGGASIFSEDFQEISGGALLTVEALQSQIKKIDLSNPIQGLDKLKNIYEQLRNQIGDKPLSLLDGADRYTDVLNKIKNAASPTETEVNKVRVVLRNLLEEANSTITDAGALKQLMAQADDAQNKLTFAQKASQQYLKNIQQFSNVKTFVNMAAGLGQVASGINNIVNLTKVWKNENLSSGEKILQTFTNLSMTIPMLVNGFTKVKDGIVLLTGKILTMSVAQGANTGITIAQIAAQQGLAVALQQVAVAAWSAIAPFAPLILAIGGVVAVGYLLYKTWNQEKQAAQKAAKAAQEAKQKYDDVKTSFQELKSSIENYHNAQDAIKNLTKGTQEWRDAIKESNDQVLQLLDKYPQLAAYVKSVNGQLQVSDQGFDTLIESQSKALRQAQAESIKASEESRQANLKKLAADIAHETKYETQGYQGGSFSFANSQQVLAVAQALNNLGNVGEGEQSLAEAIVEQTGLQIQVVEAILQHKDSLISLGNQIDSNTQASKLMYEQVAKENLGENKQYQGLSEEEQAITEALVAKKLAEAESAQEAKVVLDNLSSSVAEATALFNKLSSALPSNNQEAMEKFLTGQSLNGLSKQQLQNLNPYDQQTRKFFDENYQQFKDENGQQYKDGYAFQQAFIAAQQEALAESEQIISQTVDSVRKHFSDLDNQAISIDYTQTVIKDLEEAFIKGGQAGLASLTSFYDKVKDTSKLDEVAQGFDFTNGTAEELSQALAQAGAATNLTTEQLNAYILAKRQEANTVASEDNYKTIHDIIDGLKTGDIITGQQAQQLEGAGISLDGFFTHMADGTLKLRGDAEDFFNYANTQSLDGFRKQIESLGSQIGQQTHFEKTSGYSASNGGNFEEFSSNAADATYNQNLLLQQQINFLQAIGVEDVHISDAIAKITNGEEVTADQMEAISQLVGQHRLEWENLPALIDQNTERIGVLHEELQNTVDAVTQLDPDVDQDKWKDLADYIEQYGDQIEGVNKHVTQHREAAEELAEAMLRYDHALEEVADHYNDWEAALTSGSLQDQVEAGNQLQNVYADLLDLPFENLSPDFTQSIDNLHLLQQAANGSETAYNQLMQAAQQDIESQVHISMDDLDFWNAKDQVQTAMDDMNFQDIQIGANLDTGNFLQSLTDMVNAAGMTAKQATDYLASMGIDAVVKENDTEATETQEIVGSIPRERNEYIPYDYVYLNGNQVVHQTGNMVVPGYMYEPQYQTVQGTKQNKAFSLQVESAHKKSGGGFKFQQSSHGGGSKAPRSSGGKGGGGGKGGKGSTPKAATQAKINTSKITTNQKAPDHNPYQQEQKSFERQSKILDDLQDKQKKLVNKDRLKNLQQQNKTLEEQKKILQKELAISANAAAENSTANYADRLRKEFGKALQFDSDGQISDINALEAKNAQIYNAAAKSAADAFEKEKAAYNDYIQNTWNKYTTQDQQNANKAEKERWDDRIKAAETAAKDQIKAAEDEYKTRNDLINQYNKAWQEDQKRAEQIQKITDEIYEKRIEMSKIKVDLAIDTGDFERDWLDFENKVIKKLNDDDILGTAKANAKELMSYFNSDQVQKTAEQIKNIRSEIAIMQQGGTSNIYGTNLAQAKEDLEEYMKQQMDDLGDVQELVDDIKEGYLDALDEAKEKMDDQIDQYERVNDLIDHNVKLVQMLYGDKAYDTMNKYYDMQKANNEDALNSLRMQQQYWINLMANQTEGSDAWKAMKENLDDVTDHLNDKLEEMIQNLSDQWANRVDGIIARLNNALTGGRGLDYLDEQWDFINDYDDNFLDTFESKMGIDEVTNLYQQAIDGLSGSPANQQKINKLMNDQLKILREKDHLTEYDIERAKAALEVEKARMALEDARYNKTKMRLRRDSQGNYTYQYVADEQKLGDLQSVLADAQANLYNMDKEHYTENLNKLYDTYKDYLEKMRDLTEEYNSTQDEEERARISNRIEMLKTATNNLMQGLTEDNRYTLQYLNESFFGGMGIDTSLMSAEQQMDMMIQNIPQMNSNIQDLANTIVGQGGILNATADAINEISEATNEYDANVKEFLNDAGTSLEVVRDVTDTAGAALDQNILQAQSLVTQNQKLIDSCMAEVEALQELLDYMDKYLNKVMNISQLIENLRGAYNTGQNLNGSTLTADNIAVVSNNLDTTTGMEYSGNPATDAKKVKSQIDALMAEYEKFLEQMSIATFDTGGATGSWGDASGRLAFLHQKELVLNETDTENILRAVQAVRMMTSIFSGAAAGDINSLTANSSGLLSGINTTEQLDQNVHIEANFPNVTQHTEIEQAFNNLVNMASMRASRYTD